MSRAVKRLHDAGLHEEAYALKEKIFQLYLAKKGAKKNAKQQAKG